jgi:hypothetical protein
MHNLKQGLATAIVAAVFMYAMFNITIGVIAFISWDLDLYLDFLGATGFLRGSIVVGLFAGFCHWLNLISSTDEREDV